MILNPKEDVQTNHSIANTTHDSANTDQCVTVSTSLHDSTDDHDETAPEGRRLTAPFLSIEQDYHGTEETSDLINGDRESLCVRISSALAGVRLVAVAIDPAKLVRSLSRCHEREDFLPASKCDQGTQDTLVIAEHEETVRRNESDPEVELLAGKLLSANAPFRQCSHPMSDFAPESRRWSRSLRLVVE